MSPEDILSILERAFYFSQLKSRKSYYPRILEGKIIANLFFENSTRTRFSFEVAAKRLGAEVLNFNSEASSLAKGETLYDTLRTFEALGIDVGIIRHSDDHYIDGLKDKHQFHVINAGAGKYEHPSQSLLDLFTMKEEFGSLENLTVTICGDVASSRVAKSNINALNKFKNNRVILCGPPELMPEKKDLAPNCEILSIDDALAVSDVAMVLRVQHERHHLFELDTSQYNEKYGLNPKRMEVLKPEAIIMHPGPFNRDVEISSSLVEDPKSRIFKQKENGVYTRMAILEWLLV